MPRKAQPGPRICRICGKDETTQIFRKGSWQCNSCLNIKAREKYANNPAAQEASRQHNQRYNKDPVKIAKKNERRRKWRERSDVKQRESEQSREYHLRKLGISSEAYEVLLSKQNYVCAICEKPDKNKRNLPLAVDHDHKPPFGVRGLLCGPCNRGLGLFNDSIDTLQIVIKYLEKQK